MSGPPPAPPLAAVRRRQILDGLQAAGVVRVAELAERMNVAEETIRRDLDKLQRDGLLMRTHGGAIAPRRDRREVSLAERSATMIAEKQAIARHALGLLAAGDVVALDSSTTVLELARLIPNMPLTVVTNGMQTASVLAPLDLVEVYCTGGQIAGNSASLVGPLAEGVVRQFGVTKAFMSCKGVDASRGLSEASVGHASVKRAILAVADRVILMADHTKLSVQSTAYFADLSVCNPLITDQGADPEFLEKLQQLDVEVVVAD